ncbi:ATP-binding protein [Lignipirellula cremea]|uniref:histidine kinase n=1 Tax=Lignipirellula cremea TaxID=2528010 RepID=A0A518E4J2_9BACT|nr:ATP-binding protein [Lignipirellula cremea]QDU99015.1 Autoinducer 2 sensor kinase/phosphatase LuxQ [Lignipirellula cremea]
MRLLTTKTRIAIGLACLLVSVLCTAMMLGIVPERQSAIRTGRANLGEAIAITSSDYIGRGELRRLEQVLQMLVDRNEDVLSAHVQRADGLALATVGEPVQVQPDAEQSTQDRLLVPIRAGKEKWGSVELLFRPMNRPGVLGWLERPWVRMTCFVTAACYLLYLLYLKKMIAHLDPSQTVPKRVRTALDSLAEGLLVIDKNGRIVLANQSFATWVGRSPEKLTGAEAIGLGWVKGVEGGKPDRYPWVEAIRLETPQVGVMLGLARKNKATQTLIANASPVLGHDGKYRGVLVSFDDVTQLEATRRDLREAKQVADEANQAKSDFLARMSHEIRTPMNAILGYTDVLRRGFDESVRDRQEYLDTIHSSGEHLLTLINDILDLSKIEAGRMELELTRRSPHQLIRQAESVMQVKAAEKGISLEVVFASDLPETMLADGVRLHQILINLIGNAIKFTETGGVTLVVQLLKPADLSTPAQLQIKVIDTGIGMPEEVQERIFSPFSQADSSVTRKFGGTGLGLAISKQLAEAMGGRIAVSSEPGQGSTFTVTVNVGPIAGIRLINAQTAAVAASEERAERQEVLQLPAARILAADDGVSNCKLIELVLRRAGVEVVCVANGQLAVERALSESFDVVLMDMQMPVMDGYTASTTLRSAGYAGPIVAMTAHAMQGDEAKCRDAGCSHFMTKPIQIDLLLSTLNEILLQQGLPSPDPKRPAVKPAVSAPVPRALPDVSMPVESRTIPLAQLSREPLRCSLPMEDPEFREIAQEFVVRLLEQLAAMHRACDSGDHDEVLRLAHWLKGSGGTAGFEAFDRPAVELEQAARSQKGDRYPALMEELIQLAERIDLSPPPALSAPSAGPPATADLALPELEAKPDLPVEPLPQLPPSQSSSAANSVSTGGPGPASSRSPQPLSTEREQGQTEPPLFSSLPTDDEDFREIVEEFTERLHMQLDAMETACGQQQYEELAALAHWLKGSGGTAGFDAFTAPAKKLEELVKTRQETAISGVIAGLRRIAARIEIAAPVR